MRKRGETTVSLKWSTQRLQMGIWTYVSNLLNDKPESPAAQEVLPLCQQVAAGQTPSLPARAGAYLIRAVETQPVSGGVAICLWTAPTERRRIGFVRSPVGGMALR